jgi:hypothetical protein
MGGVRVGDAATSRINPHIGAFWCAARVCGDGIAVTLPSAIGRATNNEEIDVATAGCVVTANQGAVKHNPVDHVIEGP